jgi:putative ABC transport system permease protein
MRWVRQLFSRRRVYDDLSAEIRQHLEEKVEELVAGGMSRRDASAARRGFGNVTLTEDDGREVRQWPSLESFFADVRFGFCALYKNPGFTTVAVLTLALGIGANSAIFSVVDAVLLRPLPYLGPGRLVTISESNSPNDVATRNAVAPGNYLDWRDQNHVFTQVVAVELPGFSLTGTGRPERVLAAAISAGALGMLGLRPQLGREIAAEDDRPGAKAVAMLSDSLWKRHFNGNPDVIGQTIHLGTIPYTVIGVLPAGLQFPRAGMDLWIPLEHEITSENMRWRSSHYLDVYARLKPGVALPQAREEMNRIAASLKKTYPETNSGAGALVLPLQDDLVSGTRPALLTLLVAVGFVLLIACANVANLLLVRAIRREKELSIRVALGAGGPRLVRQLLTESLLLNFAGGGAGLLIAGWVRQVLLALRPKALPLSNPIHTDLRVLLFTIAISVLTGILFGLVPALNAARADVHLALQSSSRSATSGVRAQRLGSVLVAGEIAVSLVLLSGAGLLIQSFMRLRKNDLGFRTDHTLTARVSIPSDTYTGDAQVASFCDRLLNKVRSLPGVEAAGMVSFLPLTGQEFDNSFDIVGRPVAPPSNKEYALVRTIESQYFSVLGISLLRGRVFNDHDRAGMPRAIVISESMAQRYWPGGDPLREHVVVYMGMDQSPWEIVGIVHDVRSDIDGEPVPTIYFPDAQMPYRYMVLAVRTHADEKTMVESIRKTVGSVDPDQPIYQVRTLEELIAQTLVPWRFSMTLMAGFAALALILAAAGVYGVMAYVVGQRTHEIGVRIALGAAPQNVLKMILRRGLALALVGAALGLAASIVLTRFLRTLLYGIQPTDAVTFVVVTLTLLAVAFVACWLPARRAARVDPMVALRYE